jgi:hypothetical protein
LLWCPGLAIGIRAAEFALKEIGKGPDEEIVAVVDPTDSVNSEKDFFLVFFKNLPSFYLSGGKRQL